MTGIKQQKYYYDNNNIIRKLADLLDSLSWKIIKGNIQKI